MGWLLAQLYDAQMREVERACLAQWRKALLARSHGEVLEVGAGTGANLPHYPNTLKRLVLAEPEPNMRKKLTARARHSSLPVTVNASAAEHIEAPADSFDTVVATLVLCSVANLDAALHDMRRVLRPGGQLLFIEHVGAAAGSRRLRWQRRLQPLWRRLAGNCHLARATAEAIEQAGFSIDLIERESLRKAMPIVRPTVRGVALNPG